MFPFGTSKKDGGFLCAMTKFPVNLQASWVAIVAECTSYVLNSLIKTVFHTRILNF